MRRHLIPLTRRIKWLAFGPGSLLLLAIHCVNFTDTVWAGSQDPAPGSIRAKYFPGPPVISLTSVALSFTMTVGGSAPPPQGVGIGNAGGGTLNWTAAVESGSWLSVSPGSGTGTGALTISANPAGLAIRSYHRRVGDEAAQAVSPGTSAAFHVD